jgi:hypothetical protein
MLPSDNSVAEPHEILRHVLESAQYKSMSTDLGNASGIMLNKGAEASERRVLLFVILDVD